MKSRLYCRKEVTTFNPETIDKLGFSGCLNLIRELQTRDGRELRTAENIKIIKKLEHRIKYLGRTESYKCMAALPAVNALVS